MEEKKITPLKAIRLKCLDCMCGNVNEVRACPRSDCSLFPFRFGKNPYKKKREYSDAELEAIKTRLRSARL